MAIPVVVDNDADYEEVLLQQLFSDLWYTLQQIELIQRSRQVSHQNTTRVTATSPVPNNNQTGCSQETVVVERSAEIERSGNPEFVNVTVALSSGTTFESEQRRRRVRRTAAASEATNCEDSIKPVKVSISVEVLDKNSNSQSEKAASKSQSEDNQKSTSLFSKLAPSVAPISCSLCTAVICVVGWHLLRNK